jgi:general secretion pathway protein K
MQTCSSYSVWRTIAQRCLPAGRSNCLHLRLLQHLARQKPGAIGPSACALSANRNLRQRGTALLAVLWMSAGLAAIAFSLATTVRGETERTTTAVDDLRTYYLAQGAIQRGILDMQPGRAREGEDKYILGQPRFLFHFPTGEVTVEVIPETAKLDINRIQPERLLSLLIALGQDPEAAQETAAAIVDWRTANSSLFDAFYESRTPSFRPRHASFEEIEELLSVKGVTPDVYYGTYVRDTSVTPPQLVARGGLKNCLSVYGSNTSVDVNGADPAVMLALGVPPEAVSAVVARRPFNTTQEFAESPVFGAANGMLRYGGNSIYTLRATARLRRPDGALSDLRRTVSATIDFQLKQDPPVVVLRWYDRL